uniref:Uncharacterized protein n=1 Tax=Tanacetum cinerariifolium TaxID=118510 RepID=A0A699H3F1_TANCI|nr:hypothetical protein [Tanacetum cinerariifolium]
MDDPNITMEEYIRLEEEKTRRRGKVFNWETKTEFPAIVFNDTLTSEATLSCEPTVSFLNDNEIDFRISFDESDDEDYTVIFDKNLFSYKIIYVSDLKTDSENDNEKVNMPSFPPPKPTVSYFYDLYFLNYFENEFPAIVYNDAQTSKSNLLTEPILNPQHIDEFNLKDETSLPEYDEEEQNVICFNDLFPFNSVYTVYPNPMDMAYSLSGRYPVYTTYSLNEYSVYMYQYGVSWGMGRRIDFLYSFREIDEYWWRIYKSGNLEVLNLKKVVQHTISINKRNLENLPRKYQGSFSF